MIRLSKEKDIEKISKLLSQVLTIHANIRPDIFIPNTTKYTKDELIEIIKNDDKPIFVAVDEDDNVQGYAFCIIKNSPKANNTKNMKFLYIDDLCVDESVRGMNIGKSLFEHIKTYAKDIGCYEITLYVWSGNTAAEHFYEKMGMTPKLKNMELIL